MEVPLITLKRRSPNLWKVDIYSCSLFDKWTVGWFGDFLVLFYLLVFWVLFFFKTLSGVKGPPVYNCLVVRVLAHGVKELDF